MSAATVGIVDYGMGNRRSVEKAIERVGGDPRLTSDPDVLAAADGLVVPGVGAFPEAMRRLRASGLDELVHCDLVLVALERPHGAVRLRR